MVDHSTVGKSLTIRALIQAKRLALRRHVWYETLNRVERALIDLTVRYISNIKSKKLASTLTAIIDKLQDSTKSRLDRLMETVGLALTT